MDEKADAGEIRAFLGRLQTAAWLDGERKWWPSFLFHYTDICNVPGILADGCLLSRHDVESRGCLRVSSGSPEELARTCMYVKRHVCLYFRPKTPTQYHAEGIKSSLSLEQSRYHTAHCPVPVFLLFDAASVLARSDSVFSDGGLNTRDPVLYSSGREFAAMPWNLIYHNRGFDPSRERSILHHRQAEVLVPHALGLEHLRHIVCRSEAEKETLLHMLPNDLGARYQGRVYATGRLSLHYRKHTFVEKAVLAGDRVVFYFSPDTQSPGPFDVCAEITAAGRVTKWQQTLETNKAIHLSFRRPVPEYAARLHLDGHLAYAGAHQERDLLF